MWRGILKRFWFLDELNKAQLIKSIFFFLRSVIKSLPTNSFKSFSHSRVSFHTQRNHGALHYARHMLPQLLQSTHYRSEQIARQNAYDYGADSFSGLVKSTKHADDRRNTILLHNTVWLWWWGCTCAAPLPNSPSHEPGAAPPCARVH